MSHSSRSFRVRTGFAPFVSALAGLAALLSACGSVSTGPGQTESATQGGGAVTRVEIDADAGTVELRPGSAGSSQVQRTLRWSGDRRPEYSQTTSGDTLKITARCPDGSGRCETDLVVTVPASTAARATVSAGQISVDGLTGAQDLTLTTGRISGTALGGQPVTARTTTGQVALAFAAPPRSVDAEATTGDVKVQVPDGAPYQVDTQVQTGNRRVEVQNTPGAPNRISARSTTGQVAVTHG